MKKRSILIRNCENYRGLGEGWYRVAVRMHEDNLCLINALKDICPIKTGESDEEGKRTAETRDRTEEAR